MAASMQGPINLTIIAELLQETLIMLLEIYAPLWKAIRETVLLLWYPIIFYLGSV